MGRKTFVIKVISLNENKTFDLKQLMQYQYCISCFKSKSLFSSKKIILTIIQFSMGLVFLDFSTFSSFSGLVKFDRLLIEMRLRNNNFHLIWLCFRKNSFNLSSPSFLAVSKSSWNVSDATKPDSSECSMAKSVSHGTESQFCKH